MSNHLTGGPPATPPHVQYEYPLKHSEPLLMRYGAHGAPLGVAMVGVPGRINHKDRQRTMCDVCDPPGHTRANRPNVRNGHSLPGTQGPTEGICAKARSVWDVGTPPGT
jgi:hypothetical protein